MSFRGSFFCRARLYIDANNAGTGLPLPGNKTGGARSVEKGCWAMNRIYPKPWVQNPLPRRRVRFSAAKSCYGIRPRSLLSAYHTYCRIFILLLLFLFLFFLVMIDGENQGHEGVENNTFILSDVEPSSQTYHCFCPLCISSLGIICQSLQTCL